MKCKKCGHKAAANMRQHRLALCQEHYLEWVPEQTERFIRKYRMFGREERVLVAVSGGKDSTATALHLAELGVSFVCVFADTGWEAPETYAYIADVLDPRFCPITTVRCDYRGATCMESLIRVKSAFPWRRGRSAAWRCEGTNCPGAWPAARWRPWWPSGAPRR